jgi:hypothetical protein
MDQLELPNPTTMTVIATFAHEIDLQEKVKTLPINYIRNEIEILPGGNIRLIFNRFRNCLDMYVELDSGRKSVRLTKYSMQMTGCKNLEEAHKISEKLKLEVINVHEIMVNYTYKIPFKKDKLETFYHFSQCEDFKTVRLENNFKIKYKKTIFRLFTNKIHQSSRNSEEAHEAYNELIKNFLIMI